MNIIEVWIFVPPTTSIYLLYIKVVNRRRLASFLFEITMEIWKEIPWYNWIYEISNIWRFKSFQFWKETILKPWRTKGWYMKVWLHKDNIRKEYKIHRLVAQAFLWLDINNYKILVCHKKETLINWLLDNSVDNLFIWTHQDNSNDMVNKWRSSKYLLWRKWKLHHCSKAVIQYSLRGILIKKWWALREAWVSLNIAHQSISWCCNWKRKTAWGFIWKYDAK